MPSLVFRLLRSLKTAKTRGDNDLQNIPMQVELPSNVTELTTCGRRSGGALAFRRPFSEQKTLTIRKNLVDTRLIPHVRSMGTQNA